jgi:CRISPR-associated endonuclease Csy4
MTAMSMDHYCELRLLPDPEFPPTILMNALFTRLHRGLVEHRGHDIGISFPDARDDRPWLGQRLRLHGGEASLRRLLALGWHERLRDHVTLGSLERAPSGARQRVVRRVQAKSNPERLRRRLMARHGLAADEAASRIPDTAACRLELPFVTLTSQTTGQQFRLFIQHQPLQDTPVAGAFSLYGLSPAATVPWF